MENVNDWCFRGIYKGGLWKDGLYVCALSDEANNISVDLHVQSLSSLSSPHSE